MEQITYRLDQFEGPLDLLLTLIQKNKFDIADIPIAIICDQYMAYINEAASHDLDVSSDFIVMASRLMLIKSRTLLPRDEEKEEDPREELARAVLEYAKAKEASALFAGMYSMHSGRMVKDTDEIAPDNTLRDHDVSVLSAALSRVLSETRAAEASAVRFTPLIKKRAATATEKAYSVMRYMYGRGRVSAEELFAREETRSDMIAVFLAILELLRAQRVYIVEDSAGSDGVTDEDTVLDARTITLELSMTHKRGNGDNNDNENDNDVSGDE